MVTLQDIADKIGTSRTTVSQVLAGKAKSARISELLAEKIRLTAKELGYQKDDFASALITGHSNVSALLVPEVHSEYTGRLLKGMMEEGEKFGHFIKVISYRSQMTGNEVAEICRRQRLNAVVVYNLADLEFLCELKKELDNYKIELIFSSGSSMPLEGKCVRSDNYLGGRMAFEHLYGLGHRKFFICADFINSEWAQLRFHGFFDAASQHKIRIASEYILENESAFYLHGAEIFNADYVGKIFKSADAPTAIFSVNDNSALQMMNLLQFYGLKIPQEISIVGYGNSTFNSCSYPTLSSVEEHLPEVGRHCIKKINRQTFDGTQADLEMIAPEVIARNSSGPVKK